MSVQGEENSVTGSKILVVDDVPKNIQVLGSVLRQAGHQVIPATSGEQALQSAETHRPDLILLDVMMPEMDGHEVLMRLRENPALRDTPVIFVTALTDKEDEKVGLELGAVDYITKPINIPITLARVRTHLTLRHARRRLEEQNAELIEAAELREDVERIMRHDLKNPLQMIVAAPTVVKMTGPVNAEQESLLKDVASAGYRMLDMINRSLDLYKMERGDYVLKAVVVNLIQVIGRVVQEIQVVANRKLVTIDLRLGDDPPASGDLFEVMGEGLLCHSMLGNLIKNAVEASPKGGRVTVTLERASDPSIHIHNLGAVPAEIRDTFFEKYATSGKHGGTGLGTYSARLIAETQRGTIAMRTSDEEGTTMTITLPPPS
jgi:CheY-like chemotaxis protein